METIIQQEVMEIIQLFLVSFVGLTLFGTILYVIVTDEDDEKQQIRKT